MASQLYLISFIAIIATISGVASQKNKGSSCNKDGKTYQIGDSYNDDDCNIFTCEKVKKKTKFVKSFNETHCCKHEGEVYKVGEYFNTTSLNISCSVSELKCSNVSDFKKPAIVTEVVHHNHCCAYHHRARPGLLEYFDEFYNSSALDRFTNFTLMLEIGHNVTLPEKCMNLTCSQIDGMPVLSPEYIYRSCNCCYYNGSLYRDGERNITMEDGRNASCCNGELVMPIAQVNFTQSNSTDADGEAEKFSIDSSLCWASCFKADNIYHKKFLEIIQKLQKEQALKNTKGTCFVIDGSVSRLAQEPASIYNYERNLAIMLSLALPVNGSNPMFGVKYQNYGSCSERHKDMSCKSNACSAAQALSGHSHMNVYEAIGDNNMEVGMMWHGMALIHDAITDTSCSAPHSNEMVIALANKQWIKNGLGGGNAYHPNWVGPDSLGRTVAAIGVDSALDYQLEGVSSREDLAWRLKSDATWRQELSGLVTCMDKECCSSAMASSSPGVPKMFLPGAKKSSDVNTIQGTDPYTAEWN